jgi:hypothetical protein
MIPTSLEHRHPLILELLTKRCDSAINVWAYKALPINYFDEKGERSYGNKEG